MNELLTWVHATGGPSQELQMRLIQSVVAILYPTTRFYDNASEGKPGTRPSAE